MTTTPPPRPWPSESYNFSKSHLLPLGHIPTKPLVSLSDSERLADETCPRSLCFTVCLIKARLGFKASRQLGGPGLRSVLPDYMLALRPGSPWGGCSQGHTTGCHAPRPQGLAHFSRRQSTQRPRSPVASLTCVHAGLPGSVAGLLSPCTPSLTSLTPASSSVNGSSHTAAHGCPVPRQYYV